MSRQRRERQQQRRGLHVLNLPEKVAKIYRQICIPRPVGISKVCLRCPYCGQLNIEGQPICCDDFRAAIVMIRDTTPKPIVVN